MQSKTAVNAVALRGVEIALFPPSGYQVFQAVANDGKLVDQEMVCEEIDTPDRHQLRIDRMWRAIELYERGELARLPLAILR